MVSNSSRKIIITGAKGFVGKALCTNLSKYNYFNFIALAREPLPPNFQLCPDLNQKDGWLEVICGSMFAGKTEEPTLRVSPKNVKTVISGILSIFGFTPKYRQRKPKKTRFRSFQSFVMIDPFNQKRRITALRHYGDVLTRK